MFPFFGRYSIHDWNSTCLRKINAAPRFSFIEGNSSRTQPTRIGHFEDRVVAPLTLIAFFAAQLVRETHVWIYTSRDDRSYMNQIIQPVEQIRDGEC